jgi:hypothetical protein
MNLAAVRLRFFLPYKDLERNEYVGSPLVSLNLIRNVRVKTELASAGQITANHSEIGILRYFNWMRDPFLNIPTDAM